MFTSAVHTAHRGQNYDVFFFIKSIIYSRAYKSSPEQYTLHRGQNSAISTIQASSRIELTSI